MDVRPLSATNGPGRSRSKPPERLDFSICPTEYTGPEGFIMVLHSPRYWPLYAASTAFRAARQSASSTVSPEAVTDLSPRSSLTQNGPLFATSIIQPDRDRAYSSIRLAS